MVWMGGACKLSQLVGRGEGINIDRRRRRPSIHAILLTARGCHSIFRSAKFEPSSSNSSYAAISATGQQAERNGGNKVSVRPLKLSTSEWWETEGFQSRTPTDVIADKAHVSWD